MRRLRTWLRASIGSDRLSELALMHIHYGHSVDYDGVVDIFLKLRPNSFKFILVLYLKFESDNTSLSK